MRNPLANIAASPKENLMVRPVAANVVRISVDQMPLLLRRLECVLPKERLCAQLPHVRSLEMSGPSSGAARGPSLTHAGSRPLNSKLSIRRVKGDARETDVSPWCEQAASARAARVSATGNFDFMRSFSARSNVFRHARA